MKFDELLRDQPDNASSIIPIKNFLKNFIRIRCHTVVLPTSEIMAVLKHDKPKLHYHLKKMSSNDPTFYFLTNINMDYDKAKQRLEDIKSQLKIL